jgi:hypothetical protein
MLALAACGRRTSEGGTVVDTDISIETTDVESLSVGTEQQCIERLATVVDAAYLAEHEVQVEDEPSAAFAIENAIMDVCSSVDSDEKVHEAAHAVVHMVEDRLD